MKEYNLILDMYDGLQDARMIEFNQVNTGTCKLDFTLKNNKIAYDLTDKKVTLTVKTPSKNYIEDSILVTDANDGKCEIVLANDMIGEKGMHIAEVSIYSADMVKLQTSKVFRYYIGTNLGEEGIKVDTRYSTLQDLIFDVDAIKQEAVIDLDRVNQLEVEAARINTESKAINTVTESVNAESKAINSETARVNEESKLILTDVTAKSLQVEEDAKRTEDNSSQVSNDKGVVTRYKNEVANNTQTVASDKAIVDGYKATTLQYKNDAALAKTQTQQLKTDVEVLANSTIANITTTGNTQVNRVTTEGTKQVDLAKTQATLATTKATEATQQADRAKAEADNASVAGEEGAKKHVTLDSVEQSNFNFIENKVIQNGFIKSILEPIKDRYNTQINGSYFTQFIFKTNTFEATANNVTYLFGAETSSFYVSVNIFGRITLAYKDTNNANKTVISSEGSIELNKSVLCTVFRKDNVLEIKIGNFYCRVSDLITTTDNSLIFLSYGATQLVVVKGEPSISNVIFYNRPLTPQEIQHNFSVLNNSPSINQLQITDSNNQTSILSLGTDGNHVEMATGRTLEEEYMGVLEGMSQEYTSNGEAITVNDGLKARLVGAEITGQTVKNIFKDNTYTSFCTNANGQIWVMTLKNKVVGLKQNTQYTLVVDVIKNTLTKEFYADSMQQGQSCFQRMCPIPAMTTGRFIFKITSVDNIETQTHLFRDHSLGNEAGGEITFSRSLYEGWHDNLDVLPFGLNSTVATISNNQIKYPLYQLDEEGNKKQILLNSVRGVGDKLTMNSDGSLSGNVKIMDIDVQRLSFAPYAVNTNTICVSTQINEMLPVSNTTQVANVLCDIIKSSTHSSINSDEEAICNYKDSQTVYFKVLKSKLETQDINGVKKWLTENIKQLKCVSKTPTTYTVDKSVNAPVLTNQSNILSAGEAVAPSSFKVKVPINLASQIQEVKALINSPSNLSIHANYVEDEYNKCINDINQI